MEPAQASDQTTTIGPEDVLPGDYKLDPTHTQVTFTVSHMGFSEYSGRFDEIGESLRLDPKSIEGAQLDVAIAVASVSTTSRILDEELKGDQWFDAARFAKIGFRSTDVHPEGPGRARIDGELTMHGVTDAVSLDTRFVRAGTNPLNQAYTVGFQATGVIRRSSFGMETYIPLIGDEITLTIAGAFERIED